MRHVDGITVNLYEADAYRYKEYANSQQKRHRNFDGVFASRLLPAPEKKSFEVHITFDENFDLYEASGVAIFISVGDDAEGVKKQDNCQVFWLNALEVPLNAAIVLGEFKTWEMGGSAEPTGNFPFEVPAIQADYVNATADWLVRPDFFEANQGCVSVCVSRGHLTGGNPVQHSITDPPNAWREATSTEIPKTIHGEWFTALDDEEGLDYVFEFRNVALNTIVQGQDEAAPNFGFTLRELRDRMALGLGGDTADHSETSSQAAYQDLEESEASDYEQSERLTSHPRSRKRRRTNNAKRSFNRSSNGSKDKAKYADEDDDEELPIRRESRIKTENTSERASRQTQEPTPPDRRPNQTSGTNPNSPARAPGSPATERTLDHDTNRPYVRNQTAHQAGPPNSAIENENEVDFDLQLREAEIVRDFQLREIGIERKKRAHARSN